MASPQSFDPEYLHGRFKITILKKAYSFSTLKLLLLIMSLAVLLRLGSAVYQGKTVTDLPGVYDQISYDGLARRVADGYGFSFAEGHWPATRAGEPTAHWSYLYTLYLAAIYKVFGPAPLIARMIQALIAGIFQTLLVWRIGTRLFGRTAGLIAALLNAVYIYFFYYAGALITETFYITCILWTFDASFRIMDREAGTTKWTQWLELGFAIGLTVLLRQVFLLFLPFLYLWLWWYKREGDPGSWRGRIRWSVLKGLTISTVVLAVMILPFTIRNYRAFGTFVLLNTNAGFAFFWGNHPVHGTEFQPLLAGGAQEYYDLIPKDLLPLNEAELDKTLLQIGVQYVLDDPGRFFLLSLSRAVEYFKFWPSPDSGLISNISRIGSFGLALPFMLYGIWVAMIQSWKTRSPENRRNISLLLVFVVVYTGVHLVSWTLVRYRLPVDAVLIVFAALGIGDLLGRIPSLKGRNVARV